MILHGDTLEVIEATDSFDDPHLVNTLVAGLKSAGKDGYVIGATKDGRRVTASRLGSNISIVTGERPRELKIVCRGPGTELHKLLARLGIAPKPGCACNSMAVKMNRHGPKWCREHLGEILDVMQAEAKKRGLPFPRIIATQLVHLAIRKANKTLLSN